ncbi:MAG TPA: hypothetical protein IAD33_11770 [Candidatus Scatomorpha gallistercoris]|nr:hypothetical protein [Candidatus Scatomorpha gallistercoris]
MEVILSYRYKPEDVACEYCVNSRRRRCRITGCPWLAERIEAGVVGYAAAVRELFWRVENEAFIQRLGLLVLHFRGSFWLNREHEYNTRLLLRSVGYEAWRNPRFFAALYLFGSNRALMKRAWNACLPGGFEPRYMVMRGVSEHDYTLTQAAKALMCGGLGLTLYDLADVEIVDDEAFRLIVNALLIANYGPDVLRLDGTEITY